VEPRRRALSGVERQLAVLIRHVELLHRRSDLHELLDRAGYLLLRALDEKGAMNINSLGSLLGLDPSTVGRQVAALQSAGLVERAPDPADRRSSFITPTAEGLTRLRITRKLRTECVTDLLAEWTDAEVQTFAEIVEKYNNAVAAKYLAGPGLDGRV
jgi:DNA-binding MarR family transcriptional regulator